MPYNEIIEEKIERVIGRWKNLEKKKMFGGICYLINGSMGFGIYQDYLIVRTGMDVAGKKLKEKNVKPFDITGKAMKGWVMVDEGGWRKQEELKKWLDLGRKYVLGLGGKK